MFTLGVSDLFGYPHIPTCNDKTFFLKSHCERRMFGSSAARRTICAGILKLYNVCNFFFGFGGGPHFLMKTCPPYLCTHDSIIIYLDEYFICICTSLFDLVVEN